MVKHLFCVLALLIASASFVRADDVSISVTLDAPQSFTYVLAGQSAFIQYHSNGTTGGNQLDGITSPGAGLGFTEVFPPPTLAGYLSFAYFGIIETRDVNDTVVDTSLIVAFQPGVAEGLTINDLFPLLGLSESQLVTALTTTIDSPEFDALASEIDADANTHGSFSIPPLSQIGDTLDLIAFTNGEAGDLGVKVGELSASVVPEPTSLALAGLASLALLTRRRAA